MYLGPLSTSCISYTPERADATGYTNDEYFNFAGEEVSVRELLDCMLNAARKQERVKIGRVEVTTNYIWTMIQFAFREGWFCDELTSNGQDHEFDANEPTPGAHWNAARELRKLARQEAAAARHAERTRKGVSKFALVRRHQSLATRYTREAEQMAKKLV